MNKKHLYGAFVCFAIALNALPIQAKENSDRLPQSDESPGLQRQGTSDKESSKTAFVCATQESVPTMYAYTPGQIDLEPLMSWHSEYLLREQSGKQVCLETAAKLQALYQQQEAKYLKAETIEKRNLVCLVTGEEENCVSQDSQTLFSVNPNYEAGCVLDNMTPLECKALRDRGNVYSFDNKPYQPIWWPW